MHGFWQDIRYGIRTLAKNPAFTTMAVLTLALGIGANTAIFSVLDPLLLRKLPVRHPDELVWVNSSGTLGPAEISDLPTYYLYRDKAAVFSGILGFSPPIHLDVTRNGRTISASGQIVSGNYFSVLGVHPFAGRLFEISDENAKSGAAAVVLSFDFWCQQFGADPTIVGEPFSFIDPTQTSASGSASAQVYTVVGIAPPEFTGAEVGQTPGFYLPLGVTGLPREDYFQSQSLTILGRLKSEVSIEQAQAGLEPLVQQVQKISDLPKIELQEWYAHALLTPAARGLSEARAKFSLPARILMAIVGLLLLIACGNVANLLLARGMARKREFTVRLALGAGRWRVIRQLLAESALLAVLGALAGVLAGVWASRLLVFSLSSRRLPVALATGLNLRSLVFTAFVLVVAAIVCGLAPALSAARGDLAKDLKVQGSGPHRSYRQSRIGGVLLVAQIALSVMMLCGAGLLLHSLFNLETFDAGFDRDRVLSVTMNGYSYSRTRDQIAGFYDQLLDRVRHIPGVESASYASFLPISGKEIGVNVAVEGYTLRPGEEANERFIGVSPGYFRTIGIQLLEGRDFNDTDVHPASSPSQSTGVAVINRTMAHRFFGDASPLGKHFRFVEGNRPPLQIIGVVADSKYNDLREAPLDFFYIPGNHGELEIRTAAPSTAIAGALRDVLKSLDGSVTITSTRTLREQVDESLHPDRLIAALCSVFSALALILTCIGLYGTLAFNVVQRTSEIGIRMTLGAHTTDIFRLVIGRGMKLTILGLILGVALAVSSATLLGSLLFGVKQTDAATFFGVATILLAAAALACYLPARRAMRVDPIAALRDE